LVARLRIDEQEECSSLSRSTPNKASAAANTRPYADRACSGASDGEESNATAEQPLDARRA
jgi:hypothetical protein